MDKKQDPMKDLNSKIRRILILASKALATDGAHHKQWYLEEILGICGIPRESLEEIIVEWERGIPP